MVGLEGDGPRVALVGVVVHFHAKGGFDEEFRGAVCPFYDANVLVVQAVLQPQAEGIGGSLDAEEVRVVDGEAAACSGPVVRK